LKKPFSPIVQTRLYMEKSAHSPFKSAEYTIEVQKSINGCQGNKVVIPSAEIVPEIPLE